MPTRQEKLRKAGISVGPNGYTRNTSMVGTFTNPNQEYHYHSHTNLNEEEIEMAGRIREALKKKQRKAAIKYFWHTADIIPSNNTTSDSYDEDSNLPGNTTTRGKEDRTANAEAEEEFTTKAPVASISDVFSFLESTQTKLFFFIGCIASIASGLVFPALAFLFSNSFSDLSNAQNGTDGINELVVTFLYLGFAAFIASIIQNALLEICASRAARAFSLRWFQALLRQDAAFFDVYDITSFASNLTTNSQKIKIGLGRKLGEGVQFLTCTVGGLAYAFYSSWRVSLIIIVMLPFVAFSALAVMKFNQGRTAFAQRAYANAGGVAYQTISSIKTVLSLNAIPEMIRQYQNATAGAYRYAVTPLWKEGVANGSMLGSFIFLYLVLTVYGSRLIYVDVRQTGCDPSDAVEGNPPCQNTGVDVFAAMLGVAFAGQGMSQIASFMEAFGNARAAAFPAMTAILRSLDNDPEEQILVVHTNKDGEVVLTDDKMTKENDEEVGLNENNNMDEGLKRYALPMYEIDSSSSEGFKKKIIGQISFQNVCFSYPTRVDQPVLEDFSLNIQAGTTIAIVGPSGGGKSTTVSLIERFYDPNWGRILLDGIDLKKYNVSHLRQHIGLVGQEPVLFADTIANNIASGFPGVSQEQIETAAKMANAHDFIKSFPKGYRTQVGDKGAQLSGGQKQRIAIARVLLKNPEILLLDEATSALDTESELVVQEAIDELLTKERRTTVIIAHRLTTIRKADVIVFLKDGKVAEMGTHEQLMNSELGLYRYLVEKQLMIKNVESGSSIDRVSSAGALSSMLSYNKEKKDHEEDVEKGPVSNVIKFKNVKFSYPSRPEKPILNNFNLNIKKGETMALVGPSGGGKSTTVGLIERFYDPDEGLIRFENKKITKVNVGWLRHQIGYVGQEPTLFNASIATNISYGSPGASDNDIRDAAVLANAHDFINKFPDKYDTEVGERGTQISGGQKQRIAIARALVKKPKVLLLDEATSALDSASEHVVQEALDKLMASSEHTTIVIAHRLSTIRNVDRIAYISDGIVQEIGSHDELMAKPHGRYRRLVKTQERTTTAMEKPKSNATSDVKEENQEEEGKKTRKRRGAEDMVSKYDEDATFDPKWARNMAKQDINYFIVGAVGIILAGAVFPAWGIMFGLMIKTLFYPVFPCTAEDIALGISPFYDCDEFPLPGCFNDCDAYWQFVSKEIESDSFVLAGYWALVILCCLMGNTLSFIGFGTASERMNKRIRDDTFTALVRQEVGYFDMRNTGNITSALEDDAAKIHTFSGEPIRTFLLNVSSVAVGITVSFIYMWQFALLSLAVIPLMGFATAVEMKLMLGVSDETESTDVLTSPGGIAVETLLNMKTVASLSIEKLRFEAYKKALESNDEEEIKMGLKTGFTRGLSIIIQQYVNALQFWWGGWLLSRYDNYSFDDFLIAMFALLFSLFALGAAAVGVSDKEEATKAATRVYQLIHRESQNDPLASKKGSTKGSKASTAETSSRKTSRRSSSFSSPRSKSTLNSIA